MNRTQHLAILYDIYKFRCCQSGRNLGTLWATVRPFPGWVKSVLLACARSAHASTPCHPCPTVCTEKLIR
jgi:hypothetical protein